MFSMSSSIHCLYTRLVRLPQDQHDYVALSLSLCVCVCVCVYVSLFSKSTEQRVVCVGKVTLPFFKRIYSSIMDNDDNDVMAAILGDEEDDDEKEEMKVESKPAAQKKDEITPAAAAVQPQNDRNGHINGDQSTNSELKVATQQYVVSSPHTVALESKVGTTSTTCSGGTSAPQISASDSLTMATTTEAAVGMKVTEHAGKVTNDVPAVSKASAETVSRQSRLEELKAKLSASQKFCKSLNDQGTVTNNTGSSAQQLSQHSVPTARMTSASMSPYNDRGGGAPSRRPSRWNSPQTDPNHTPLGRASYKNDEQGRYQTEQKFSSPRPHKQADRVNDKRTRPETEVSRDSFLEAEFYSSARPNKQNNQEDHKRKQSEMEAFRQERSPPAQSDRHRASSRPNDNYRPSRASDSSLQSRKLSSSSRDRKGPTDKDLQLIAPDAVRSDNTVLLGGQKCYIVRRQLSPGDKTRSTLSRHSGEEEIKPGNDDRESSFTGAYDGREKRDGRRHSIHDNRGPSAEDRRKHSEPRKPDLRNPNVIPVASTKFSAPKDHAPSKVESRSDRKSKPDSARPVRGRAEGPIDKPNTHEATVHSIREISSKVHRSYREKRPRDDYNAEQRESREAKGSRRDTQVEKSRDRSKHSSGRRGYSTSHEDSRSGKREIIVSPGPRVADFQRDAEIVRPNNNHIGGNEKHGRSFGSNKHDNNRNKRRKKPKPGERKVEMVDNRSRGKRTDIVKPGNFKYK